MSDARMDLLQLIAIASEQGGRGEHAAAAALYQAWIDQQSDHPLLHVALYNRAVSQVSAGDLAGAVPTLESAIRRKPDFAIAHMNLGLVHDRLGQTDAALARWQELLALYPNVTGEAITWKSAALKQVARLFRDRLDFAAAERLLAQSIELDPDQTDVIEQLIFIWQCECRWPAVVDAGRISRKKFLSSIAPLSLCNLTDDPLFQLANAHRFGRRTVPRPPGTEIYDHSKRSRSGPLKIGYVSSDLRGHAVGYGMTEVLERHDRRAVTVHCYYNGVAPDDATKVRLRAAADHWLDVTAIDDGQMARRIAEDGIDILVDLNGYTLGARTGVFARRPAPIAINWFGYPGTMGTPYHHYIIADEHIIPPDHEIYFSERVLRLPCYQPNALTRIVAAGRPTRAEVGLPEDAFVYCYLTGLQKLTELTFNRWLAILRQVPGSVLWLLEGAEETHQKLRGRAAAAGIAPERLVFAKRMGNAAHIARYPLADLTLDTLPYGSHTSASDSLWMGVPVVTWSGRSFASRVCGSLVRAAGIGELACPDPESFVARAVELGRNPEALAAVRHRLIEGRSRSILFDMGHLVERLEGLYRDAWADFEAGNLPQPDLRNLDLYHEIGLDLPLEDSERLGHEAYRAGHRAALDDWNRFAPVQPDSRLWPGGV
jgi:predicted O-linked N-acetylglucosamine transferase (SPINDLY family)